MFGNPNSSGTAYLMLATLVQVFGEDPAFKYMLEVHRNVNQYARSGIGPMTAVTRGETAIGSTVLHGVINEIVRGFPVEPVLPCEGVGYEIGSTAIIKGTRNPEAARRFIDFALSAGRAEGRARGQGVRDPDQPRRAAAAAGAEAVRDQGDRTTTSRSTAARPSGAGCSSAGKRKSTRRRDDVAPAPALARGRGRRAAVCALVHAAGLGAVHRLDRALRGEGQRTRAVADRRPRADLAAARSCCSWRAARSRCCRRSTAARAPTCCWRWARWASSTRWRRASRSARAASASTCSPAVFGELKSGQFGMGLGAALVLTAFAMLFSLGLAGRGLVQGRRLRRRQRRHRRAAGRHLHVLPRRQDPDLGRRRRPTARSRRRRSSPGCSPRRSGGWAASARGTRCGVAWNTLALALACAIACTALGLAFALIATRTASRTSGRCASCRCSRSSPRRS